MNYCPPSASRSKGVSGVSGPLGPGTRLRCSIWKTHWKSRSRSQCRQVCARADSQRKRWRQLGISLMMVDDDLAALVTAGGGRSYRNPGSPAKGRPCEATSTLWRRSLSSLSACRRRSGSRRQSSAVRAGGRGYRGGMKIKFRRPRQFSPMRSAFSRLEPCA